MRLTLSATALTADDAPRPTRPPRPSYRPFAVEVATVEDLSPSFRRLTLRGPDLYECGDRLLDQRVKLLLGRPEPELLAEEWFEAWRALPARGRPVMRTYTLAAVRQDVGAVAIDLACRPVHGPASRFAREARAGDQLVLVAPDRASTDSDVDGIAWRPGRSRHVLVAGDETAVPAIRNILAALPADVTGQVVLDLPHIADAVDLRPPVGVTVEAVTRSPRGVGVAVEPWTAEWFPVVPTARAPTRRPAGEILWDETGPGAADCPYAWLAGETTWIAGLRARARASGYASRAHSFMGYWYRGRAAAD